MTRNLLKSVAAIGVATVFLASCGSTTASSPPPGVTLSGTVSDHGIKTFPTGDVSAAALNDEGSNHLEMYDNYFSPTYIKAKAGETVMIGLDDEGNIPHTFTIPSLNINETLTHGQKKTVSVTVPQSGFIEFTCTYHAAVGMRGAVVAN